jgi:predicted ABC-type ATPase
MVVVAGSLYLRQLVNRKFEQFVDDHIERRIGFAIETTLRSEITFLQATKARARGFELHIRYIALDSFERHSTRVTARGLAGVTPRPADQLRDPRSPSHKSGQGHS